MSKYEYIDSQRADPAETNPVTRMCTWLVVSTSGFYHWLSRPQSATAARREALTARVKHFFTDSKGTYGYRRIHADLAGHGAVAMNAALTTSMTRLPEQLRKTLNREVASIYFRFKVLVEYDGWWHERDGRQRQRDRVRREALEAAGWRVIVVTSEDLKDARLIPWRVFNALKDRGFAGPAPRMNTMWILWFA